ncbi:MAG: sugar transferase [Fimbriimonadaceae bacterium]|nr:sugar transferase [Fimbriimonadaceae bacterium]
MQQHRPIHNPVAPATKVATPSFRRYEFLRRGLECWIAAVALLGLLPLFALVAVAIKFDSRGPVFYRQRRVGRNRRRAGGRSLRLFGNVYRLDLRRRDVGGPVFEMVKFRTMRSDAEAASGPVWAQENDPRVTRTGRLLRKTRLDELPQLWNVLLGEMSLVGPRPERPEFVKQFVQQIEGYSDRHLVTPGITGLSQIRQGYDTCLEDVKRKLQHDLEYIQRRSLVLDLAICWSTVAVMFTGRGAQ